MHQNNTESSRDNPPHYSRQPHVAYDGARPEFLETVDRLVFGQPLRHRKRFAYTEGHQHLPVSNSEQ